MKVMKEFLVGLIFLFAAVILAVMGFFLWPLAVVLAWFLRILVVLLFGMIAVWLLGKFIIYVWESIKDDRKNSQKNS